MSTNTDGLITLYDLSCTLDPPAWSPSTWKTRFVLNYKRLAYQTVWVGFSDIADVLSSAGLPPTRTTKPLYTVPAIIDGHLDPPSAISDSQLIADYVERTYPDRPIYPEGGRDVVMGYVKAIHKHIGKPMWFMTFPRTLDILEGKDRDYFIRSRKEKTGRGMDMKDFFTPEKHERAWKDLHVGLDKLSALVDDIPHSDEWVFGLHSPTYADFALCAMFIWFQKAGPEGGWDKIKKWNGGKWERLYTSCQQYMEVPYGTSRLVTSKM